MERTKETFTPQCCKPKTVGDTVTPALYEGTTTLNVPFWHERAAILDGSPQLSPKRDADGNLVLEDAPAENAGEVFRARLRFLGYIASIAEPYIAELSIKRLDDGFTFTSWAQVCTDSDLSNVFCVEIARKLTEGYRVGERSSPS